MSRSDTASGFDCEVHHECKGCGTGIPLSEPILVKFQRCYYCGQHHPFGRGLNSRTAPAVIVATAGLIALWWTQLPS